MAGKGKAKGNKNKKVSKSKQVKKKQAGVKKIPPKPELEEKQADMPKYLWNDSNCRTLVDVEFDLDQK